MKEATAFVLLGPEVTRIDMRREITDLPNAAILASLVVVGKIILTRSQESNFHYQRAARRGE